MKITNLSKNRILAEEVILARSFFKRLKGLLGYKLLGPKQGMILLPSNSVHTFFMHFPIDILFVDKNNKVIMAISSLKPFSLTPICWRSKYIIELPAGVIQSTSTEKGDALALE